MTTTPTTAIAYEIDSTHSSAEFSIKHMMVSTVKGRFRDLAGTVWLDEERPQDSRVEATIDVASIDTSLEMRDNDLRSANFFDAERFPAITFVTRSVEPVDGDTWKVRGDLTIRDVTREVVLNTELEGRAPDLYGIERVGFSATTEISRHEFGLTYNQVLETGGVVLGDRIKIALNIEAVRKA